MGNTAKPSPEPNPGPGANSKWLEEHRKSRPYNGNPFFTPAYSRQEDGSPLFSEDNVRDQAIFIDVAFNRHSLNDGSHVSPYDEGQVFIGGDQLHVRLIQPLDEEKLRNVLARTIRATSGIAPNATLDTDPMEMFHGGLQTALESQVVVFEVIGASRALTHQLVRTRRAAFHQQSQRATWYGDKPNQRWPKVVFDNPGVRAIWQRALLGAWEAYKAACDAGISYENARYILPEGTTNYIICEYPLREFINMFAYRGCSMFLWEMVHCVREMRRVLLEAHPFLEPFVKIGCERGKLCDECGGTGKVDLFSGLATCGSCDGLGSTERKCTFQGWENVEGQCSFPWAKQSNRVFLPSPKNRIGG